MPPGRRARTRYDDSGALENNNIPLTAIDSSPLLYQDNEQRANPEALPLRRHHSFHGDETELASEDTVTGSPAPSPRDLKSMSRAPLLKSKSMTAGRLSYDAVVGNGVGWSTRQSESSNSNDSSEPFHGREVIDRHKGKSSTVRSSTSFTSLRSRRSGDTRSTHSRPQFTQEHHRGSSPMLITEPGHPAGQGGHLGGGLPFSGDDAQSDEEEAAGFDDEDDPPDNSPYPQVRASVAATDDTTASIDTPRMWILSLLCALLGSATNLFFSLRYPSVAITPVIALVVVHPLGRLWDALLKYDDDPRETFENGVLVSRGQLDRLGPRLSRKSRFRLWLAQGSWNGKEHACVYVSSNVSFGFAFATDVIVEQSKFYKQDLSIIYQLLLTISTQTLGYSFAGLTRRYLVRPPSMVWPGTLMSTAMFSTMHTSENKSANGWIVTRWKFFLIVWSVAFAWYFLPGLLMPALSYFNVITWFAPDNVVIANMVRCSTVCAAVAYHDSSESRLVSAFFP